MSNETTLKDFIDEINKELGAREKRGEPVSVKELNRIVSVIMGRMGLNKLFTYWIEKGTVYALMYANIILKAKRKKLPSTLGNPFSYMHLSIEKDPENLCEHRIEDLIRLIKNKEAEERRKEDDAKSKKLDRFRKLLEDNGLSYEQFDTINKAWNELDRDTQREYKS